eukprot:XP_797962.2 PREDICTED: semaphorin-5B [Strongylocentrotus purpuratus]
MKLKCSLVFLLLAGMSCRVSCMSVADVDELTWGEWGECTRPCGGGTQSRHAVCEEGLDPQTCLYLKSTIARNQLIEEQDCNTQSCIETGTWGDWTDWLPCSSTCGSLAFQMRSRSCYDGNNITQGSWNCEGLTYEWRPCQGLPPCPSNDPSNNVTPDVDPGIPYESHSSFQSFEKLFQEEEGPSIESSYSV